MAGLFPVINLAESGQEEVPSLEFLEFLAEWETSEGEWAGPEQFEDDSFDQLYDDNDEIDDDE